MKSKYFGTVLQNCVESAAARTEAEAEAIGICGEPEIDERQVRREPDNAICSAKLRLDLRPLESQLATSVHQQREVHKFAEGVAKTRNALDEALHFKWGGWRWFGVFWGVCGEICFTANNWRAPNKLSAPIEQRLTPIERRLTPLSAPIERRLTPIERRLTPLARRLTPLSAPIKRRLTPPMQLLASAASSAPPSRTYRRLSGRLARSQGPLALGRTLPVSVHTRQALRERI